MRLYLVRHGETDWNRTRQLQGILDVPLNEYGRMLARHAGKGMKDIPFTAAFASELSRAYETAGLILSCNPCYKEHCGEYLDSLPEEEKKKIVDICGVSVLTDSRIHEMDTGPWTRLYSYELPGDGLKSVWKDPEGKYLPEGVETAAQMLKRAEDFLSDITGRPELKDRTVLIVTHGGFLRSLLRILSGGEELGAGLFKNCEAAVVDLDENGTVTSIEKKFFYDPDEAPKGELYE